MRHKIFKISFFSLVFEYNPTFHNVLQVNRSDFHSCDATSPIATYTTGNDSIVINSPGHYYYICGFVGHCQAGQKVDLRVPKAGRADGSPISSPIEPHNETLVPEASSVGPMAPGPSHNSGLFLMRDNSLLLLGFGLLLVFVRAFNWIIYLVVFVGFKYCIGVLEGLDLLFSAFSIWLINYCYYYHDLSVVIW